MMINNLYKWIKSKFQQGGKFVVILFIILYPVFFYSYILIPSDLSKITFLGITFKSLYFESIQTFVWTLLGKILPFLGFTFWYLSSKAKWINVLHIPIAMYLFQIIRLVQQDIFNTDTFEFFFVVPLMILYIILLTFYKRSIDRRKKIETYKKELVMIGSKVLSKALYEKE